MVEKGTDAGEIDCGLQCLDVDVIQIAGRVEQRKCRRPMEHFEQGMDTLVVDVQQEVVHFRGRIKVLGFVE